MKSFIKYHIVIKHALPILLKSQPEAWEIAQRLKSQLCKREAQSLGPWNQYEWQTHLELIEIWATEDSQSKLDSETNSKPDWKSLPWGTRWKKNPGICPHTTLEPPHAWEHVHIFMYMYMPPMQITHTYIHAHWIYSWKKNNDTVFKPAGTIKPYPVFRLLHLYFSPMGFIPF